MMVIILANSLLTTLLQALKGNIMRIGIPRERLANEARVAATPSTVTQLLKLGFLCV